MQMNFKAGGYKAQAFYVLWVLENYSNENKKLKQSDIVKYIRENGHDADRKSVGRDLLLLKDIGFNVHGVGEQLDDNGNEIPMQRGKIWLERDVSDEKLQMLIDNVLFSSYLGKNDAKELIAYLISQGGKKLKAKSAASRLDGSNIFHQDNVEFFKELRKIKEAMIEVKGVSKKISFKYAKYKYKDGKVVLEPERKHFVSPYFFVSKKGNYYLVGYNHEKECLWHYRLDYVRNVEILNENAKSKYETELKGKTICQYVAEHPYMFSGSVEGVEARLPSNRLGIVIDTFGSSYRHVGEQNGYSTVRIYCSESDAFHWAMQYGTHVEVLSPKPLRDAIRTHVKDMMARYSA